MNKLFPAFFIGHGSPMNAIEENKFTIELKKIGKSLPIPSAIVSISAHWYTKGIMVTAMENPRTIHDFGGFPDELYHFSYSAKGSPVLAKEVQALLQPISVIPDLSWGLDHGTWSLLTHLFPKATVPVIQISIDHTQAPQFHYEIGKKLQSLRAKNILLIGSGNIIHNLRLVDFSGFGKSDYGYHWAEEAQAVLNERIKKNDIEALCNYKQLGEAVQKAIPTPEHYLPLLYLLGSRANKENISFFNDSLVGGSLSMTSIRIG